MPDMKEAMSAVKPEAQQAGGEVLREQGRDGHVVVEALPSLPMGRNGCRLE